MDLSFVRAQRLKVGDKGAYQMGLEDKKETKQQQKTQTRKSRIIRKRKLEIRKQRKLNMRLHS